jgi:phospholipase D1/2
MCVIDETIAFMGGLDLCFGRWDTPAHVLVDDGPAVKDDLDLPGHEKERSQQGDRSQIWPGKDYS